MSAEEDVYLITVTTPEHSAFSSFLRLTETGLLGDRAGRETV